jgi:hypothetical protein
MQATKIATGVHWSLYGTLARMIPRFSTSLSTLPVKPLQGC